MLQDILVSFDFHRSRNKKNHFYNVAIQFTVDLSNVHGCISGQISRLSLMRTICEPCLLCIMFQLMVRNTVSRISVPLSEGHPHTTMWYFNDASQQVVSCPISKASDSLWKSRGKLFLDTEQGRNQCFSCKKKSASDAHSLHQRASCNSQCDVSCSQQFTSVHSRWVSAAHAAKMWMNAVMASS